MASRNLALSAFTSKPPVGRRLADAQRLLAGARCRLAPSSPPPVTLPAATYRAPPARRREGLRHCAWPPLARRRRPLATTYPSPATEPSPHRLELSPSPPIAQPPTRRWEGLRRCAWPMTRSPPPAPLGWPDGFQPLLYSRGEKNMWVRYFPGVKRCFRFGLFSVLRNTKILSRYRIKLL
ncbi:hypothetical protein DAI22_03g377150 [Oryza sativa Japonica Group]|nr:hypothetical protein DAI22_03g377150 [Oryza sativa Japonica Group]